MTHLKVDPVEFLERLAVLTPRPRINLVLMRRMFGFDVLQCPRCGGPLRLLALWVTAFDTTF